MAEPQRVRSLRGQDPDHAASRKKAGIGACGVKVGLYAETGLLRPEENRTLGWSSPASMCARYGALLHDQRQESTIGDEGGFESADVAMCTLRA